MKKISKVFLFVAFSLSFIIGAYFSLNNITYLSVEDGDAGLQSEDRI